MRKSGRSPLGRRRVMGDEYATVPHGRLSHWRPRCRARGGSISLRIAIIGLRYVGAVTSACLAQLGRSVIGVDQDPVEAEAIAAGRSPIAEPGLDDLLAAGVAAGSIQIGSVAAAVPASDAIMITVGTPSARSGALDLTAVLRVASEIGAALP